VKDTKSISIGISDFKKLIESNFYFADKSLLIRELLDAKAAVTLIPRPRRFGKTLNLSMLRYFFEKDPSLRQAQGERGPSQSNRGPSNRHLFNGLAIEQHSNCMAHQGKYPVIWLTFKDIKTSSWELCYRGVQEVVTSEFSRHRYLLTSDALDPLQKRNFAAILDNNADEMLYRRALLNLSEYLAQHHQKHALILLDEYDTPIHAAFIHNYYDRAIEFFRDFLGAGLKDNSNLEFSVVTGILRVAKESIFSGINNLRVCSLTDERYADKFGFLEHEVITMLDYFWLKNSINDVRKWFDGYQSGLHKVYNPWSIINLVDQNGKMQPYWVNTSDNLLIHNLARDNAERIEDELKILMDGGVITKQIDEGIIYQNVSYDMDAFWNFLLFNGYLTFENYRTGEMGSFAELKIPNVEVASLYRTMVLGWFRAKKIKQDYQKMLASLADGNTAKFKRVFELFTGEVLSVFDTSEKEPEKFYHILTLGMFSALMETHEVRSNRESGIGRYDVMILPKDHSRFGIIIEFKNATGRETLLTAAKKALEQIADKKYETELRNRGLTKIIKLGISFKGKESFVLVGS